MQQRERKVQMNDQPRHAVCQRTLSPTIRSRLDGEKVAFTARAGTVHLRDAQNDAPQADVAYVSYERAGAESLMRPVAFVFNGGTGRGFRLARSGRAVAMAASYGQRALAIGAAHDR